MVFVSRHFRTSNPHNTAISVRLFTMKGQSERHSLDMIDLQGGQGRRKRDVYNSN
jgi:hypothetical protein